jgi:negative regulator of sigma E activity
VALLQEDPTGLSSPVGQIAMAAMLLVVVIVGLRFWWGNRRK